MDLGLQITDNVTIGVSDVLHDSIVDSKTILKDAIAEGKKKALLVTVDATHCGYINKNFYYYTPEGFARNVDEFVHPYRKPALADEHETGETIGRVWEASYVPIAQYLTVKQDSNGRGTPQGKIRLDLLILDETLKDVIAKGFSHQLAIFS